MKLRSICAIVVVGCGIMRAQQVNLLPQPENLKLGTGTLAISGLNISFASAPSAEDRFAAQELARGLQARTGDTLAIVNSASSQAIVLERTGAVDPLPVPNEKAGPDSREAYHLVIDGRSVRVTARSSAGVYYGVQTLLQLARNAGHAAVFPQVTIDDWPSLPYRGTLVDVGSEGPMSTVDQVKKQIGLLARFKGNQYYFYSEANIEMDGYPLLNPHARFTKAQVRDIIAYARQRHVDVVPAVELYGHLHDLFRIERYSDLADFPHGGEFDPRNPKVKALLQDWIGQLASLFPSPFVDVGFDETFAIEQAAEKPGANTTPVKLFIEQLSNVSSLFHVRGKHVMAYGDIMVKFPEIVAQLPPGVIALAWAYGIKDPEYRRWLGPLVEHHVPFMVLPAVHSWAEVAPDFSLTFANIDTLVAAGRKSGTLGLMNTVWTDDQQVLLQQSWPGFAYGAVAAWQSSPVRRADFLSEYSAQIYSPAAAADIAQAFSEMNAAELRLQAAFGEQTMQELWADPFWPGAMESLKKHRDDFHECRLHAENAEELLYRAIAAGEKSEDLPSLLMGAQLLDYAGMKFLYAVEINDAWATLPPQPTKQQLAQLLSENIAHQVHSRTEDLMDAITELKNPYRRDWLAQYTDYRLGTALGRWDAEYEYWRRAQSRLQQLGANFHDGEHLPSLEELLSTDPLTQQTR
ncbi:MAG: glycoside hydrolase family 20 zincin-like fold domain-containing protein [Terriglobales bacterium]